MSPFKIAITTVLFFLCFNNANAQLKASFTASKYKGCSPIPVTFYNTSTGTSPADKYSWQLGNGNKSTDKDSVETQFTIPQTYTVTLTVTDTVTGATSIDSAHIIVYINPTSSFTVSSTTGCTPFTTTFTSTSTTDSGSINSYYWAFDDGDSSSLPTVSHTFKNSGNYTITLIVSATTGCSGSLTKIKYIDALLTPSAAYKRNKDYLCAIGDKVVFTDQSLGLQSPVKYSWRFGDGDSSNVTPTSHPYNSKGIFQDSLIVTNADGCADTAITLSPIYLSSFKSNFKAIGLCADANISFLNTSVPLPDTAIWHFGNNIVGGKNATYKFDTAGVYKVELINTYGACADTVMQSDTVLAPVTLGGFSIVNAPLCGGKTLLALKDTSSGSVAWQWSVQGISGTTTTQAAQYQLTNNNNYLVSLTVTKASGCTANATDTVQLTANSVKITTTTNNSVSDTSGCAGLIVNFSATPPSGIKSYLWNFGDGSPTSTDSAVTHTYNNLGVYPVRLIDSTLDGCTDTIYTEIQTTSKPVPIFYTPTPQNCGSKLYFYNTITTPTTAWLWYFSDDTTAVNTMQNAIHTFPDTGYYSVKFIAYNGACYDSVTYTNYIHVLAPLIHIDTIEYTCNYPRDTANFFIKDAYAQSKLTLDFGDSSVYKVFDTSIHVVTHVYDSTGTYRAVISGTNYTTGCTVRDTDWVHILYNQYPQLRASDSAICENDSVKVWIAAGSLAKNPGSSDSNYYSVYQWQYLDTSNAFTGVLEQQPNWYYSYLGILKGLSPGQTQLRVILQSEYYGCFDTTQYLPLKVFGPIPGYYINNPKNCFRQPLSFVDTSKITFNVKIVEWLWGFGDRTFDTLNVGGTVLHEYNRPGQFATFLRVTDSLGCFAQTNLSDTALPSSPKADFDWTPTHIVAGTTATFNNTSNAFEDKLVDYKWSFTSDSKNVDIKTKTSVPNTYTNPTTDTVTLIATAISPADGCADTLVQIIPIKEVYALFKTAYRDNCPPIIANFTSQSINADTLKWDFGDGSPGTGLISSTDTVKNHPYTLPGVYVITLYAYKNGQALDSVKDTIVVKGAYAKLHSDITQGCVPTSVHFSSDQVNATSFKWDFGVGTSFQGNNSDTMFTYNLPSIYYPSVILYDSITKCTSSFSFPKPILVDSLKPGFTTNLKTICDSAKVNFISNAASFLGDSLIYHWSLDTLNAKDTSNLASPSFFYRLGNYPIMQTVKSVDGCVKTFTDTIHVVRSVRGVITGPVKTCDSLPVSYTGSIKTQDSVQWNWSFGNGITSQLQNPPAVYFTTGKDLVTTDTVLLVTVLNNCYDTAPPVYITINPKPYVGLQSDTNKICVGTKDTLRAYDGSKYVWTPQINIIRGDSIGWVQPQDTAKYSVTVFNKYGCSSKDSTIIDVVKHLPVNPIPNAYVCVGQSLLLSVPGADSYIWLKDSATIDKSDYNSASALVTPTVSPTTYIVQLTNECFVQKDIINVSIEPFPTLTTFNPVIIPTGDSAQLHIVTSPNVDTITWSPAIYLSCTDCAFPYATPRADETYTVRVATKYGCATEANVAVHLSCSGSLFFPSAFTPEGKNPVFYPVGKGVKYLKYLKIFDRGGQLLYEEDDVQVGATNLGIGWDGTIKGNKAAPGTYVYVAEAQCDTGEYFTKKGTVVLIR